MSSLRAAGVWQSPFYHSPGTEDWKLHECSECIPVSVLVESWMTFYLCISESHLIDLITGWLCRQCSWLPNGFSVEVSGHQSKQTWDESYALCRDGKWPLLLLSDSLCQFFCVLRCLWTVIFMQTLVFTTASSEGRHGPAKISRTTQTHWSCSKVSNLVLKAHFYCLFISCAIKS